MKRFYFGNDEGGEEEDADDFGPQLPSEFISMAPFESPWRHLIESSIRVCERSIMWRFMSPTGKMNMIKKVFEGLSEMQEEYEQNADV